MEQNLGMDGDGGGRDGGRDGGRGRNGMGGSGKCVTATP